MRGGCDMARLGFLLIAVLSDVHAYHSTGDDDDAAGACSTTALQDQKMRLNLTEVRFSAQCYSGTVRTGAAASRARPRAGRVGNVAWHLRGDS